MNVVKLITANSNDVSRFTTVFPWPLWRSEELIPVDDCVIFSLKTYVAAFGSFGEWRMKNLNFSNYLLVMWIWQVQPPWSYGKMYLDNDKVKPLANFIRFWSRIWGNFTPCLNFCLSSLCNSVMFSSLFFRVKMCLRSLQLLPHPLLLQLVASHLHPLLAPHHHLPQSPLLQLVMGILVRPELLSLQTSTRELTSPKVIIIMFHPLWSDLS